ncbi:MAG TPA: Eco57I restriction-modification methylase domain-containing protein [Bacteroidales bacterium]|nr:Eco57I restriction-modification methylase domain-containing protein [Bacteroidales bacterium]HCI56454.1 hypothetical protein [Bacteroidales bacterium]HQG52752.1 Eco57I restriction-modification methylase domain-containing protein [Bacteroidales bacterium]HRC90145.1 Eco57I restriction-modification methylase domain-containing protein [Bacteroidales bacterium]
MNAISKQEFKRYIESFDFVNLFNQLGWTYIDEQFPVKLKEETYLFNCVAEKSGFRIIVFKPANENYLPDYATRLQLDRQIGKLFREHLIIFCDNANTIQIWQLSVKRLGKPTRLSETRWYKGQEPELLYQKASNLFFTLDEEDKITIADVVDRVNENFSRNVEQVTKKFYERFRKEHENFLQFITGISNITDQEWYASLMLNRLMFCYFIQKKGFLDNNLNYLKDKLNQCQKKTGRDKFYINFYKSFLLILFHRGLGAPEHTEEIRKEFGTIPYLNGGLFDVHELEKKYADIDIKDDAFEAIFNFFDQYNWHLDTRITATGRDINPDVIGYIFEKYINDRAQMGAYYTKEDITDYISKNCIIPFLFDETERKYPKAFKEDAWIWQMLRESGDTYIYDALKKGIDINILDFNTNISIDDHDHPLWSDMPDDIRAGFRPEIQDKTVLADDHPHLWEIRKPWNQQAPEAIALPAEIYRELIERRKRYWEVRKKIDAGEINKINDFITYNLNIRQFAQDIIDNSDDPDLIKHFYEALINITILDPTCGSGAFLFAALNILEPLYESCIMRMRAFVEDEDILNAHNKKHFSNKYKYFRDVLCIIQNPQHPNLSYFIYKSIILRNLYGVDIMKEAVEIAKLRLFLKLVATVDPDYNKPNLGLEPLPDIDFNIRAGNTLIGYASQKEIEELQGLFITPKMKEDILEECDVVAMAFRRFKELQLKGYENKKEFTEAKNELNKRLKKLSGNLNKILHKQYYEGLDYNKWEITHQPFHWFAEFYEIINNNGGFDVVIGNPPYVQYSSNNFAYKIEDTIYETYSSYNLYSYVFERSQSLINNKAWSGMIVQISCLSTPTMETMRQRMTKNSSVLFLSNYATRPAFLFEGVTMNLTIIINQKKNNSNPLIYSSKYQRWFNETRKYLFESITYTEVKNENIYFKYAIPKFSNFNENVIIKKILRTHSNIGKYLEQTRKKTTQQMFYRTAGGRYFKIFIDRDFGSESKSNKSKYFSNETNVYEFITVLSSNTWWWWYTLHFDMYNCKDYMLFTFPYKYLNNDSLINYGYTLCKDLLSKAENKIQSYETTGKRSQLIFTPSKSKYIIDNIDQILAEHYGFTEEELDFIINYDIKYRMGHDAENNED